MKRVPGEIRVCEGLLQLKPGWRENAEARRTPCELARVRARVDFESAVANSTFEEYVGERAAFPLPLDATSALDHEQSATDHFGSVTSFPGSSAVSPLDLRGSP